MFSENLRKNALLCRDLALFCDKLSIDISYRKNSLIKIFGEKDFKCLDFINPDLLYNEKRLNTPLCDDENREISRFVYSLGKSDEKSQLILISEFKKYINRCEKKYIEKYKRNVRIYPALGLFLGIVICAGM